MSSNWPDLPSPRPRGILKNASYNRDSYHGRPSPSLDMPKEQEDQDETSPLIRPQSERVESPLTLSTIPSPEDSENRNEADTEDTKSSWYLLLLTLSIGGLQIAWSVELSNGSVSQSLAPQPAQHVLTDRVIAVSSQLGYQQVSARLCLDRRSTIRHPGTALRWHQERQMSFQVGKEEALYRRGCFGNHHLPRAASMDQGDCAKLLCPLPSRRRVSDGPCRFDRVGCKLHLHS